MEEQSNGKRPNDLNFHLAKVTELIGRLLIERRYFQSRGIPTVVLAHMAHDLAQKLQSHQEANKPKRTLFRDLHIIYKQLRGIKLTEDDERYEADANEIDVWHEIFTGVQLAGIGLLGRNLVSSISSSLKHGLWRHVPAIAGYFGVSVIGPFALNHVVNQVLGNCTLSNKERGYVRPWLVTFGRLLMSLSPRVHANEYGVHYQYPSVLGSSETYSSGVAPRLFSEDECPGHFLDNLRLRNINVFDDGIELGLSNKAGELIPVRFRNSSSPTSSYVIVQSESSPSGHYLQDLFAKKLSQFSSMAAFTAINSVAMFRLPRERSFAVNCVGSIATAQLMFAEPVYANLEGKQLQIEGSKSTEETPVFESPLRAMKSPQRTSSPTPTPAPTPASSPSGVKIDATQKAVLALVAFTTIMGCCKWIGSCSRRRRRQEVVPVVRNPADDDDAVELLEPQETLEMGFAADGGPQ